MTSPRGGRLDIVVPHLIRRTVLTSGRGGPLTLAHGELSGRPAELVADRARLELRRDGAVSRVLELPDWSEPARGAVPAPSPTAEAWRFRVVADTELSAEVVRVRHRRSPLAEATRYWRLEGDGSSWFFGDGGAPDEKQRDRTFHLWRDDPGGVPVVTVGFVDVRQRDVEDVLTAGAEVTTRPSAASDVAEELAVLLAVGGFNRELVGRDARVRRVRRWLVEEAIDSIGDQSFGADLEPFRLGP